MTQHSRMAHIDCTAVAAREARRFVTDTLIEAGRAADYPDAELVVAEIVNNAVRHTNCVELRVDVDIHNDGRIRLAVIDADLTPPTPRLPHAGEETGRGLMIVEAVAADWGVEMYGRSKAIWVELRAA